MTTVGNVVERIRRDWLSSGRIEPRNRLAADINDSVTALTFMQDLGQMQDNSRLSIGLEDIYVWTVDETAKTAEVDRGVDGSTATPHTTGDIVRVNPRFSDAQIVRAMNDELGHLYNRGLYRVAVDEVLWAGGTSGYELDAAADEVYQVQWQGWDIGEWNLLDGWEFERNQDFASTKSLTLLDDPGRDLRVTYKAGFTSVETLDQDLEDVSGLPATAVDVLAMGVALALGSGRELSRNYHESQGNTRRAEEVPPGAEIGGLRPIMARYEDRLAAEKTRLAQRYPPRRRR